MRCRGFLLAALQTLLLAVLAPCQKPLLRFSGIKTDEGMGFSMQLAGDVDKDGKRDFVVGAPRNDWNGVATGAVRVYSGKTSKLLFFWRGEDKGGEFGYAISGAGDVNGDGYEDVLVGSPREAANTGAARVFSGLDGEVLRVFHGREKDEGFAWSVAGIGDLNLDGHAEIVVGVPFGFAPRSKNRVGCVKIFSGKSGKLLRTLCGKRQGGRFGWSLASIGDLNRDGRRELLVGVEGDVKRRRLAGSAVLFSGKTGSRMRTFTSGQAGDYFGASVASAGDIDGDGRDDLIIGGWNGRNAKGIAAGIARVFSGRNGRLLFGFAGDSAHDRFGAAVSSAGDVNGDGIPDLAVGAPQTHANAPGYVRLFSGKDGSRLRMLIGENTDEGFGTALCRVEDRNGDDIPELLVGAPFRGKGGAAALYPGTPKLVPGGTGH